MDLERAGAALIRPGQLLAGRSALSLASRWTQAVTEVDGICTIRLSPGVDPCELAASLRDQGHRASPNHVFAGQPLFFGGPASRPFPAEPVAFSPDTTRSPVTVAVLDTGIAPHPWWAGSDWYSRDCPDEGAGAQAGHGTFIAGLLVRQAPGVRLRVVKLLDGDGITDEAAVVRALHRLRVHPPQVLNLSFGGHSYDDGPPPLLADALGALAGTVTVACAGNTASDRPFWPAALPHVVAVAALDPAQERRAPFSAFGPWVDACARGEWLTSAFLDRGEFSGYAHWSGTSFASALVAGAIAEAAGEVPPEQAAAQVLGARQIPDLGALVPVNL